MEEDREMEAPEIATFARNFSVMVRVQGPDPKGLKMRRNAFHLHRSGKTTISASGLLLFASSLGQIPRIMEHILKTHQFSGAVVITAASVVQPFLIAEHRSKLTQPHAGNVLELSPRLIHDTCIDVLVEGNKADNGHGGPNQTPEWLPAKLLAVDVIEKGEKQPNVTIGILVSILVVITTLISSIIFGGKKAAQPPKAPTPPETVSTEKKEDNGPGSSSIEREEEDEKEKEDAGAARPRRSRRET